MQVKFALLILISKNIFHIEHYIAMIPEFVAFKMIDLNSF